MARMFGRNGSRKPQVLRGYRRMLVPVVDSPESERAVELACRLASDRGATLVAVAVVEVPALLPLDAHMLDEETEARALLDRACATADSYGVAFSPRMPRAREGAAAIVDQARAENVELVIMGAGRGTTSGPARFGATVKHVLETAPCRVMLVAADSQRMRVPGRVEAA